jgi:hypothetical protein
MAQDLYGIFFDNDPKYINEVRQCPQIRCIKVPGSKQSKMTSIDVPEFASHINGLPDSFINLVAMWLKNEYPNGLHKFDSVSGFNNNHSDMLSSWIDEGASIPPNKRYAIFDFDRTITQIEGFMSPLQEYGLSAGMKGFSDYIEKFGTDKSLVITPLMMMKYLCGTDRLPILQSAFNLCKDKHINIVILTNNAICKADPLLIEDLMSVFGLKKKDFILLCSNEYRGNKKVTLQKELEYICSFSRGKKTVRKKTIRNIFRKKTIRKKKL